SLAAAIVGADDAHAPCREGAQPSPQVDVESDLAAAQARERGSPMKRQVEKKDSVRTSMAPEAPAASARAANEEGSSPPTVAAQYWTWVSLLSLPRSAASEPKYPFV